MTASKSKMPGKKKKRLLITWFRYMAVQKRQDWRENKAMVARSWMQRERFFCTENTGNILSDGTVLYRDCGHGYLTECTVNNHWVTHYKRVSFILCKLYLNQPHFLKYCNNFSFLLKNWGLRYYVAFSCKYIKSIWKLNSLMTVAVWEGGVDLSIWKIRIR
jgi:hypothetical protein